MICFLDPRLYMAAEPLQQTELGGKGVEQSFFLHRVRLDRTLC